MKHASTWLDSLMEISRGEREPFGSRWTFTGTHLPRGEWAAVAAYPVPGYWAGRAVVVLCEAVTEARNYMLLVPPARGLPGYSVNVEPKGGAKLAAQLADAIFNGLVSFEAAGQATATSTEKINMSIAR